MERGEQVAILRTQGLTPKGIARRNLSDTIECMENPVAAKKRRLWPWILLAGVASFGTCVSTWAVAVQKGGEASDKASAAFHKSLDDERYADIYRVTTDEFRATSSEKDFTELMVNVRTKLGKVTSTNRVGINVSNMNGVTTTVGTYETVFASGKGTETFTWRGALSADQRMLGYDIRSNDLIKK